MATNTPDTTRIDGIIFGLPMAIMAVAVLLFAGARLPASWQYAQAEAETARS